MGDIRINVDDIPTELLRTGPMVGDVYKKDGGPAGFMLIVCNNGSTHSYVAFNPEGKITGVGQGTDYYFARRFRVGRVDEIPAINVAWDRP